MIYFDEENEIIEAQAKIIGSQEKQIEALNAIIEEYKKMVAFMDKAVMPSMN